MVAVDSLIPYARNARTHSEDQVAGAQEGGRDFAAGIRSILTRRAGW